MFHKNTIVFAALLAFSPAAGAAESILLGVFPRFNLQLTMQKFTPLARYLSQQTGLEVKLETAPNFETFWKNVTDKRYHLAHYNQ
jgi:ABC-type phosphate/phosphonate transport system substrate-binding protein